MQTVTLSWLKSLPVFEQVPDAQLQWLIDSGLQQVLEDGEFLFNPGDPITGPHLIIAGNITLYMVQQGTRRDMSSFDAGDITGYLPYSRAKVSGGYARANGQVQLLSLPAPKVQEMIKAHFELTQSLVHVMSNRVRDFTAMQQQNEKMMALGKLSAGLAHELNNPASAIVRDSAALKTQLQQVLGLLGNTAMMCLDHQQAVALQQQLTAFLLLTDRPHLTLMARTALEDELTEWLQDHEIHHAAELAESFADFNCSTAQLEAFAGSLPKEALPAIFSWISNLLLTDRMAADIQESSKRIAGLVNSIKNFTHMDRAQDKQYADIHTGIHNTLTMLGHKIRKGNITVIENYDTSLPEVKGLIGELNQVWTNLIDNSLDAMEASGKGTLTISTRKDREFVQVEITDDGQGIDESIQSNIFDPFFTTKAMGQGTGLGLEVVQRIIHQHNGTVTVKSSPGHTTFRVCFPYDG